MKKKLPVPDTRYMSLLSLSAGPVKWELLKTAVELNLFDFLQTPDTAAGVSAKLETHPANTGYLLKALVSVGWLEYDSGTYWNADIAETFLTTDKDTAIGKALIDMAGWNQPVLNGGMLDLVRNGPLDPRDFTDESVWETVARSGLNYCRCGRAQLIADQVAALLEFPGFEKILDMGAGPGIIGIAVADRHPGLACVLFDRPEVCRVADEVIAEYGVAARVKTMPGNYMEDPVGTGYDLVMANFTLNFYRDRLDDIMAKTYEALAPGGVFMVTSDALTRDKTAPAASVVSWLPTTLQGMDMSFSRGEIDRAMIGAGFVSTQSRILESAVESAHGPVDMIVARKTAG